LDAVAERPVTDALAGRFLFHHLDHSGREQKHFWSRRSLVAIPYESYNPS
jgi:hypothetical protein